VSAFSRDAGHLLAQHDHSKLMNDRHHSSFRSARQSEEIKNEAQTVGDCGQSIDR
jgi:hypothetical protein